MEHKEQFLLYKKKDSFDSDLENNNIKKTSVAFISEESKEAIHTQNHTFSMVPKVPDIDGSVLMKTSKGAVWSNIDQQDILSYGVRIDKSSDGTNLLRTGNLDLHRSLPIQSGMYGVVVESTTKEVKHFLNPNDWRYGVEQHNIGDYDIVVDGTLEASITDEYALKGTTNVTIKFRTPIDVSNNNELLEHQKVFLSSYILHNNVMYKIVEAIPHQEDNNCEIVAVLDDPLAASSWQSTVDSINANGLSDAKMCLTYSGVDDWNTMVYIPGFYIKSWETDTYSEVRIAETAVDDSWEYCPPVLVSAYLCTKSNNKYKSVANSCTAYNGSSGSNTYNDLYTTDPLYTSRNKPMYSNSLANNIKYAANNNSHIITYREWRNLYWLYVIEYASCYMGDDFNNSLNSEGFHQGGIGPFTKLYEPISIVNISPNTIGLTDRYGNKTNNCNISYNTETKSRSTINITNFDFYTDGRTIYSFDYNNHTVTVTKISQLLNMAYISPFYFTGDVTISITGDTAGKTFNLCKGSTVLTTIGDGNDTATVTIDYVNTYLFIKPNFTGDCNITFKVVNTEPRDVSFLLSYHSNRYRGIENIVGVLSCMLDKVIQKKYKNSRKIVFYECDDVVKVTTEDLPNLNVLGESLNDNLYINYLSVGNNASIFGPMSYTANIKKFGLLEYTDSYHEYIKCLVTGGVVFYTSHAHKSMVSFRTTNRDVISNYQLTIRIAMDPSDYNL